MTIDQIAAFAQAEGLTIKVKDGNPSIAGGTPSDALMAILKGHRADVIKAASEGYFDRIQSKILVLRCDDCKATVFNAADASRLCNQKICPMRNR
jgi:hypothetical protein